MYISEKFYFSVIYMNNLNLIPKQLTMWFYLFLLPFVEDSEIRRLITELEACVSLLPAASGNTNIQVEIALAMQPLRSENAQLRR